MTWCHVHGIYTYVQYDKCVYMVYTCLYILRYCIYYTIHCTVNTNICIYDFTWITTGLRGKHCDKEQRAFTAPSPAEADQDQGSPCPEDGDFFDKQVYTLHIDVYTMYIHGYNIVSWTIWFVGAQEQWISGFPQSCAGASCVPGRFHGCNIKVSVHTLYIHVHTWYKHSTYMYMPGIYMYVPCTIINNT